MVDEAGADGVIIKDGSSQYLPSVSDRKKKSINMQYRVVFYDFHGIIIVNRKIPEKENEKWQTSMAWA